MSRCGMHVSVVMLHVSNHEMRWDAMGCVSCDVNGMGWHGMGWHGMWCDGMGWDDVI